LTALIRNDKDAGPTVLISPDIESKMPTSLAKNAQHTTVSRYCLSCGSEIQVLMS